MTFARIGMPQRLGLVSASVAVLLLAACGGGDDDDEPLTDDDYVKGLCSSTVTLQEDLDTAASDIDMTLVAPQNAGRDLADAFQKPLEDYVIALERMRPPADLSSYHNDMLDEWRFAREGMRDGRIGALDEIETPSIPVAVRERINDVAGSLDECEPVMDIFRAPRRENTNPEPTPTAEPTESPAPEDTPTSSENDAR